VITAQPGSGPTVLRILLGSQLRRLREAKGVTRDDAGYTIRASGSKISRMELGRVSFKERDVQDLLDLYGVDQEEAQSLVALARQANSPGWWHKYGDVLPDWFGVYVGLEEAASLIRLYEVQFIPGLLQTADYSPPRRPLRSSAGWDCVWPGKKCSRSRGGPGCGRLWTRRRCAAPSVAGR